MYLTLNFDNLNDIIDFYKIQLSKSPEKTMHTIASLGTKGQITSNPDSTLTTTLYFRNKSKGMKIVDAFVEYKKCRDIYIPQTVKTYEIKE